MRERLSDGDLVAGRYEIRSALAEGPAWLAYRALDRDIEVELTLWWMRRELFPDAARRHRFMGAVVELRGLGHPNLRRMFEAGEDGTGLWATAQLDGGPALPRPGDRPAMSAAELQALAAPIAAGLEAAHQAGQVHGRLVPEDLVSVAGLLKVSGAGLYRDVDRIAARSCWMRWERYVAPEVLSRGQAGPASDVWSLAVMLAELAAGTPATDAGEALAAARSVDRAIADALAPALVVAAERRLDSPSALVSRLAAIAVGPQDLVLPSSDAPLLVEPPPVAARPQRPQDPGPDTWGDPIPLEEGPAEPSSGPLVETWIGYDTGPVGRRPAPPRASPRAAAPADQAAPAPEAVPLPLAAPPLTPRPEPRAGTAPPVIAATVSHRPKSEPGSQRPTPVAPRDLKPVLRSISSAAPPPPSNLGRYAPPRPSGSQPIPRRRPWLWVGLTATAAAVLIGAALAIFLGRGEQDDSASGGAAVPQPDVTPVDAAPAPVRREPPGPCPAGMVLVEAGLCIDAWESPGQGRMPESGLPVAEAEARCQRRHARLCTADEWERACRGADGASWPYGTAFRRGTCNVMGGGAAATGAFPECRSAVGAYDMSGNVAEWVVEGVAKGSSTDDGGDGRCSRNGKRTGGGARGFADVGFRCCADARR